ncbi:MAG: DUF2804 domain-containing protein [Candidatus Sericytochromatia bacterium]|nr:DUF2804 domain-containing protein [Candidatus Sericytochromatia bacterium]
MQTQTLSDSLPPAPARAVDAAGAPAFGTYQGTIPHVSWETLRDPYRRPRLWRYLHQKRWQYVGLASPACYIGIAIVDIGWAATAFAYCFDRVERRVVAEFSAMGVPGLMAAVGGSPGEGAHAYFGSLTGTIRLSRLPGTGNYELNLHTPTGLTVAVEISALTAPPTLSAVVPIAGGVANCTHKSGALRVRGDATVHGRTYPLSEATASLDHTVGLLARDTHWQWASAHSPGLGFNLQAGFNGGHENGLWLDGDLIRLGAAEFTFDAADPLAPWQIRTSDGLLDLTFQPEGLRREDKNLIVAVSRYVQPIGTFSGTVRRHADEPARQVADLLGVTEDHHARW